MRDDGARSLENLGNAFLGTAASRWAGIFCNIFKQRHQAALLSAGQRVSNNSVSISRFSPVGGGGPNYRKQHFRTHSNSCVMRTALLVMVALLAEVKGTSATLPLPGSGGTAGTSSSSSNGPIHPTFQGSRVSDRVVKTNYGKLRGRIIIPESKFGITLQPVEVFLGIPYVSPPIGTLRFLPPMNSPHWEDIRDADHFGPVCPQKLPIDLNDTAQAAQKMPLARVEYLKKISQLLINQSEDCLFLNIYAPAKGE